MRTNKIINAILAGGLALSLTACVSNDAERQEHAAKQEMANKLNNDDLYEVEAEGRFYVFDDFATYQQFLQVGETSFRQTFIGAGPHGKTLVFGMTSKDKKKPYDQIAGYNLYMGTLAGADDFYGEMRIEGESRIYVFSRLADMKQVRETGEAALRFSDIGSGPNGETVIYVLHSGNKKVKPVALMDEFKKRNGIK
jgi:hypothetical protein